MRIITPEDAGLGFELKRRFRASPERIFRAWTQPAALREWWCPPGWQAGAIEIDLRIGGGYRIAMARAGSVGASVSVSGEFLDVRPPERLIYTWRWAGAFAELPVTQVTLELQKSGGVTLLTLRHEGFNEAGARQQHRSGWMSACDRLDRATTLPEAPVERPIVL